MRTLETLEETVQVKSKFAYEIYYGLALPVSNSSLFVYTNEEAKPAVNCDWFYRVMDEENFSDEGELLNATVLGSISVCDCSECNSFGTQLSEYISVVKALNWIKTNAFQRPVELWVSSERFLDDAAKDNFGRFEKIYQCSFLQNFGKQLNSLLSDLKVEVLHYSYANKEIIRHYF